MATSPSSQTPNSDTADSKPIPPSAPSRDEGIQNSRGFRFWMVMAGIMVSSLLSALEGTVVSTALSTIVDELGVGSNYPWVANAYFLTSACFQPFWGQMANIFGRRYLMIFFVSTFMLGSGIAGGAATTTGLLAGRTIQGIGGGGINMFVELIVCDLVPLRERGKYIGLVFVVFAIGTSIGPVAGGLIATRSTWRWVFYLNLPIGGASLVLLILFLQVRYDKESSFTAKIKKVDIIGNALITGAVVAILIAISWGGTRYPWRSAHVLAPLILGLAGLLGFMAYEASGIPREPVTPPRLFANRTSTAAFFNTFVHALLSFWTLYILPVYFQGVLRSSPARSGVQLLPTVITLIPVAAVAGALLTKVGRYRIFHQVGFVLLVTGLGSFVALGTSSPTAVWVITQIITALGSGVILPTLLPAVQAPLPESDVATSTGTWAFVRNMGIIWGLSIPASIFNTQVDNNLMTISDPAIRQLISNGKAYAYASNGDAARMLSPQSRAEVSGVFAGALKLVWKVSIAFAAVGFIATFLEKDIKMRTDIETEYGLKEETQKDLTEKPNSNRDSMV